MPLFVYDKSQRDEVKVDIDRADALNSTSIVGVDDKDLRHAVRVLTNYDVLLIPDRLEHCTQPVEKLKTIAHQMDIDVRTITSHIAGLARQQKRA